MSKKRIIKVNFILGIILCSGIVYGVNTLLEGMKAQEIDYANTPKSVSSGTSIYLPQIMRDFPEFHLEEMRERAENVLRSYLYSINEENSRHLTEGTDELRAELDTEIAMRRSEDTREHFEDIRIHKTEIFKYNKQKGRVSIVFQSAVGHINYVERNGKIIKGKKDRFSQCRYVYVYCYIRFRIDSIWEKPVWMVIP